MARGDRNAERMERSDIRKASSELLMFGKSLPKFDCSDAETMEARCRLCFDKCGEMGLVPTYGAMAMFIGTSVQHLLEIRGGRFGGWDDVRLSRESARVLQKNLELLEAIFDVNFENGAYPQPVTGIFASKNLHGWKDSREVHELVATIEITPDQIAQRYQSALPMHVDSHGELHRLSEGIGAEGAAKTATVIESRIASGEFDGQ